MTPTLKQKAVEVSASPCRRRWSGGGTTWRRRCPSPWPPTNKRYGWPLRVIEDAADDPPIEQATAFLMALDGAFERSW